ncbi:MAG: beta-ketoacyl-ACP synthase 3 [Candidatus Hydrogenedentota bacterium]
MNHQTTSQATSKSTVGAGEEPRGSLLTLYRYMLTSRRVDEFERELVASREGFFHVAGAGHEATAVFHFALEDQDWLHLHYRDKALMLARGVPPAMFFHSLIGNAESHSMGRQMSAHMSDPARRILSLVGPVGNNALQAVGVAAEARDEPERPVVLCAVGDGTSQQGEFLEAVAEAVRSRLPVLFLIEDNAYSISTRTAGKTFYDLPDGPADHFHGLPIHRLDGRYPAECMEPAAALTQHVRESRDPALAVFRTERLTNHTNADDQRIYRSEAEVVRAAAEGDPIHNLRRGLLAAGMDEGDLERLEEDVREEVAGAAAHARAVPDPEPTLTAKAPLPPALASRDSEYRGDPAEAALPMGDAIREVLRHHLTANPRVSLFGEDIEDPKGDVFGVTRGLSTEFPGRVINSPLSEATIAGKAVGRALAGGRPVAFLQFADFLPLAFNQIMSELGSIHWRTNGGWEAPVIVMIPCGGYRPGLGPFHAQTLESIAAHVPGVDAVMPSTAGDAAGLLNAAFLSGRPTLFFYPKTLLNDREGATSPDIARQLVPPGAARHVQRGDHLTLVSYGGTMLQCRQTAQALTEAGIGVDLIDLRSLFPWDRETVCESASRTGRLLVVHEDNATCGMAGEIIATVTETLRQPVQVRRVTRPDTYVPYNFPSQLEVLPSFKRILTAAAEMLDMDLSWLAPPGEERGVLTVEAQGASPADESVTVVTWHIQPGAHVEAGQHIAELDADKAVFDFHAPGAGIVESLLVKEGETVRVGSPLLRLRLPSGTEMRKRPTREEAGTPILKVKGSMAPAPAARAAHGASASLIKLAALHTVLGSREVPNEELASRFPDYSADDIFQRTGIRSRRWAAPGESALSMAADAARGALAKASLTLTDIDAVIVSTTTPDAATPSTACRLLHELSGSAAPRRIPAYDISAACSGYLYALASGFDAIRSGHPRRVLAVTTEMLSAWLTEDDFETTIIFGDAASATVLTAASDGEGDIEGPTLARPILGAEGEPGEALYVGLREDARIRMRGRKVFTHAVRAMLDSVQSACDANAIPLEDLALVVPHQANGRILTAVENRLPAGVGVRQCIEHTGNTSSSSIPLALANGNLPQGPIALTAFGGGFTYGAAILRNG